MADDGFSPDGFAPDATPGITDQLHDFAAHTFGALSAPFKAVAHPIDTIAGILRDSADEIDKGKAAWNAGDKAQAEIHFQNAVPIAGPFFRQLNDEWNNGQYGAMAGDVTGAWLGGKAVKAVPGVVKAAPAVAQAVRTGGSDMATGAAKIAAGGAITAAGHAIGGPVGATVAGLEVAKPLVTAGAKQFGAGASATLGKLKQLVADKQAGGPPLAGKVPLPPAVAVPDADSTVPYRNSMPAPMGTRPAVQPSGLKPQPAMQIRSDGQVQVLRDVPLDDINPESSLQRGNSIDPEKVKRLRAAYSAGDPVPPVELQPDPDGQAKYGIFEGNHRITAQVANGAGSIRAWVPADSLTSAEPRQPGFVPQGMPQPSAFPVPGQSSEPQMPTGEVRIPTQDLGNIYGSMKETPEGQTAYGSAKEVTSRTAKARAVAQVLNSEGVSSAELKALPPATLKQHLGDLAKALRINQTGNFSDDAVNEMLFHLNALEQAGAR